MAQNRFYSSVAFPTFLTAALGASGNPQVASITGNPSSFPYTMLIDWGLPTQEAISVTSAPTGTGPFTLPCTRGIDGTTAQSHSQNAVVVHGISAEDYNELQVHISTGVSGAAYPNVIHGLANTSAVVGTIDTQTLTNKTLGATSVTGDLTISVNEATNPVVTITNTHSAPASSILRLIANAAADATVGIRVSGDTVHRVQLDSNGKVQWGPGGATAVDTDLYRSAAGTLKTDTAFVVGTSLTSNTAVISSGSASGAIFTVTNTTSAPTAPSIQYTANAAADSVTGIKVTGDTQYRYAIDSNGKVAWGTGAAVSDANFYRSAIGILSTDNTLTATVGVQVGGATTTFGGGTGVLGITNASVKPTTNPANGAVIYAATGGLLVRDAGGGVASLHSDPSTQAILASAQTVLGSTLPQFSVSSATIVCPTATNTLYMTAIWLPAGQLLTKINWITGTTAGGTMTHWWLGIADSGGVQRAHTTDQLAAAIAASSNISLSFASTYTTTYSGTYWLLLDVTASVLPTSAGVAAPIGTMGVIGGTSATAAQAPGTDGTTTYALPATQGVIPMMFLT